MDVLLCPDLPVHLQKADVTHYPAHGHGQGSLRSQSWRDMERSQPWFFFLKHISSFLCLCFDLCPFNMAENKTFYHSHSENPHLFLPWACF